VAALDCNRDSGEKRWVKIATFNVNGINGRLPVLLRWLAETAPDVVCPQEGGDPNRAAAEEAVHSPRNSPP
jgi:exonuclease III